MMRTSQNRWLILFVGMALLLLLARMFAFMRGALFLLLGIAALGVLIWGILDLLRIRRQARAFNSSPEGRIVQALEECREMLEKNRQELGEIEANITELKKAMQQSADLPPVRQEDSQLVLRGFQQEALLRTRRIKFYETCLGKLDTIQHNLQFAALLERKRSKLLEYQEHAPGERSVIENIQAAVETDILVLDDIDRLALQMQMSANAEDADALQLELETLTKAMERL